MTPDRFTLPNTGRYITRDGKAILPIGSHFVPTSGPDWPWRVDAQAFDDAFAQFSEAGLNTVRIDLIWAAIEPAPGRYDEAHLQVIDQIFDSAERHHLSLHPTLFVGGEVGDAYWDLPWATGRNPHNDPELLEYQAKHAQHLARRWKDRTSLIAWDLTDEPPFWLYVNETTDADARLWTSTIVSALREVDPHRLITIGTASQEISFGPFRADVTAPFLDFCCVHPYPIYSPELYPDSLLSPRMTLSAAFETAFAAGAGKSVMMHEYGASNTQFSEDRIAKFDRLSTWGSFGYGSIGFYSWCWTDAEPAAFRRAPYVRSPHETQFGMTSASGKPRARLKVISGMAEVVASLDLAGRATIANLPTASIPIPHEFVRPFDPVAFGLDDAPSGMYAPAEMSKPNVLRGGSELAPRPDGDASLLIRGCLNAFVLSTQAGFSVEFPRERLDGEWPDAPLVLVPAPLTTTANSLVHLRTSTLVGVSQLHRDGRTLYLSCSAETAIPELQEIAGVTIIDRAPAVSETEFIFVSDFGNLAAGTRIWFRGFSDEPNHRGVLLGVDGAEVLAVDSSGNPVLTRARTGAGQTIVCAYPIELGLAAQPDAFAGDSQCWMLYAAMAQEAKAQPAAAVDHPDIASYLLTGPDGGILVAANHSDRELTAPVRLPTSHGDIELLIPESIDASLQGGQLSIAPYGVAVITWASSSD